MTARSTPRPVIDALGQLAYLQVAALGDYTGEASAQRSLALVETSRLEASPWARLARATVAASLLTAGGGPDGLGPSGSSPWPPPTPATTSRPPHSH